MLLRKQRLKQPNPKQLPRVRPKELRAQRTDKKIKVSKKGANNV